MSVSKRNSSNISQSAQQCVPGNKNPAHNHTTYPATQQRPHLRFAINHVLLPVGAILSTGAEDSSHPTASQVEHNLEAESLQRSRRPVFAPEKSCPVPLRYRMWSDPAVPSSFLYTANTYHACRDTSLRCNDHVSFPHVRHECQRCIQTPQTFMSSKRQARKCKTGTTLFEQERRTSGRSP